MTNEGLRELVKITLCQILLKEAEKWDEYAVTGKAPKGTLSYAEFIEELCALKWPDSDIPLLAMLSSDQAAPLTYSGLYRGKPYQALITQGIRDAYNDFRRTL